MSELGDQILASRRELPSERIEISEWGDGPFFVRSWTGRQRDQYDYWHTKRVERSKDGSRTNIRALVCALSVEDDRGELVFDLKDVDRLGEEPARILQEIYEVAARLNKMQASDVEDAEGNSDGVPSESFGST